MSLSQFSSGQTSIFRITTSEIEPDVININRRQRNYNVPEGGIILPQEIIIPVSTIPKSNIIQFGTSLGISMPTSYTRERLINRIEEILRELDYRRDPVSNLFIRNKAISLQPRGGVKILNRENDICLPESINFEVFNTIGTMNVFIREYGLQAIIYTAKGRLKNDIFRDIKELLTQQGYIIDSQGNFSKKGGSVISGGLEFNDLITAQEYVRFLQTITQVQITQNDLMNLNIELLDLKKKRWYSFNDFIQDTSQTLNVSSPIIWMAALLFRLPHENNQTYISILRDIKDTRSHRRMDERLNAIYDHFRQRINPIPQIYKEMPCDFDDDVNKLLNYNQAPEIHREFFVKLIQTYYPIIDIIQKYRDTDTFTKALIRSYYQDSPGIVQELYTFAINYPYIFPESSEKAERRKQLTSLGRVYLIALYQIYDDQDLEVILDMKQHPLEFYLYAIAKTKPEQLPALASNCGMIIPEHLLIRNRRTYILQNLHEYSNVITRPIDTPLINQVIIKQPKDTRKFIEALRRYTDQEIMTFFGYVGGFENRNTLISQIYHNISEEGFMVYNEINTNAAINDETTLLTKVNDIPKPYLVFGTPFKYRILELDEFLETFYDDRSGFKFMYIGADFDKTYTMTQVSRLQTLLPAMRNMNPQLSILIGQLLERIQSGIIRNMKRNREVDELIKDVKRYSFDVQDIIKEMLYKIFYTGMYMRKWRGPGSSYPMDAAATHGGGKPDKIVVHTLGEILELLNRLRLINPKLRDRIRTIPEIDYNRDGEITIRSHTYIFDKIDKVIKDDHCIRIASRYFVLTANYFINIIFGEVISDFDPHSVDSIS
jgi:hypothetical protein